MNRSVILDAGPLVASLNPRDAYHGWAKAQIARTEPPLLTCEAVLTEACFLIRQIPGASQAVIEMVQRRFLVVSFQLEEAADVVGQLIARYSRVPMSLADACLVCMAEQHARGIVLTLDSDFKLYRKHGRQVIPTIMPSNL